LWRRDEEKYLERMVELGNVDMENVDSEGEEVPWTHT
jgi:hypothetical protein